MRHEYKIITFSDREFVSAKVKWQKLESQLNDLGKDGWGILSIQPMTLGGSNTGVVVFLQRQIA
ncbi:MAG TPA: DUF4177 domain-containing protein [Rhodanobacteraceae bacterium]|nr:DUF4177 domain-containing protein [Rhodanobacteraceae bacterium]